VDLLAIADTYHADRILLARRGDRWGVIHQVASVAATAPAGTSGSATIVDGNGWDAVSLSPGARLVMPIAAPAGPIGLEIKVLGQQAGQPVPDRRMRLVAVGLAGGRPLGDFTVPATSVDDWQVVRAEIDLRPGESLAIEAVDGVTIQSVLGFASATAPAGWHVAETTPDAVLLARSP
ncbi:MAG TPA: hypothetical protein VHS36_06010, partial [Candidatus Limnocylindrales bacterium]|nr:hypothetical protein [Candidatus Limnocylindrales bacterium]